MGYYQNTGTSRSNVLALALAAAQAGRDVFPLRGKVPAIPKCPEAKAQELVGEALAAHARTCSHAGHGYLDATRDRSRIHGLFNAAQNATGYGVACGTSGLAVLDWDRPEGLAELKRRGMPPTLIVKTGRGGHAYYRTPPGAEIKSRDVAPGLELKASGSYVVGAGSLHPSGTTYTVRRDLRIADAPDWLLEPEDKPERKAQRDEPSRFPATGLLSSDVAGPTIPDGERNRTLARVCGRLHDGTRDLDQLTRDLEAINGARCTPPLDPGEVRRIAASIYSRTPCKPRPEVAPRVLAMVDYLQAAADERPVRGMAGASGWAIYNAGLEGLRRFGCEHPEGVTLQMDYRTWAQLAATEASTVSRWLARTPLVEVLERGAGRRSTTVLFRVPREGVQLQHSSTRGGSKEPKNGSVATRPLLRTLYRARWTERGRPPRRGVVAGTRKVRQSQTPRHDGHARMGKARAALLHAVADCPKASRAELAARLGRKPDALKKPLRWLMDAGLIVRTGRGCYEAAEALAARLEDARELGGEPEADRLQIARHERQRDGYRNRHERSYKAEAAPADGETRERRESYPERRREHIARAIARLFAEHPEYRTRRAGQIVCKLPDYLAPDFPRGPDGLPKDHELDALLDGVAA